MENGSCINLVVFVGGCRLHSIHIQTIQIQIIVHSLIIREIEKESVYPTVDSLSGDRRVQCSQRATMRRMDYRL